MNALQIIKINGTHVYYIIKYTKTAFKKDAKRRTQCQTT